MLKFTRLSFNVAYYKKTEKIGYSYNKGRNVDKVIFKPMTLGYSVCSLLNSINSIQKFKTEIQDNMQEYIKSNNIQENVELIFKDFLKINPYLILAQNYFVIGSENIAKKILDNPNEDICEIYKSTITQALNFLIQSISLFTKYKKYGINAFYVPSSFTTYNVEHKQDFSIRYTYTIYNFEQFVTAAYYQIILNRMHIKRCIYPNCNRYFVTTMGQTRYCPYSCPDDLSQTCRSIRKTVDRSSDKQENWEITLDNLEIQLNRIRTRFYDNINNKKITQRKKELISNNQQKLKDITRDLKRRIKGTTLDKRDCYLKIYNDFLNEVEDNLNLSPSVFKIKKPKY